MLAAHVVDQLLFVNERAATIVAKEFALYSSEADAIDYASLTLAHMLLGVSTPLQEFLAIVALITTAHNSEPELLCG